MSKLPEGGLVKKTNVLVQVPERYQDSIFNAIDGSNQKIGLYGNYDCVMSAWPVRMDSKTYKSIWTFCEECDREEVMDRLMGAKGLTEKPMVDLFDGRVFMLEKYDPKARDYVPRKRGKMIDVVIDATWRDWVKIKSSMKEIKGKGVHNTLDHITTWSADGFYRPLPKSKSRRGETGRIENVKYQKIWTAYKPKDEERLVKELRGSASSSELPVMSFFESGYILLPYVKDARFKFE